MWRAREAPSVSGKFFKALLWKGWLITVPIAGITTIVMTISSPKTTLISLLTNAWFRTLFTAACTVFVLGLFLLNPAFSMEPGKLGMNILIAVFMSIGLFAVSLLSVMRVCIWPETVEGMFYVYLLQTALSWLVGLTFLYPGKKRLAKIE